MTTPAVNEITGLLKKSGQVTLDAGGKGTLTFDPDNAHQRWEVTSVVVTTDQPATASVVPIATVGINGTDLNAMSPGNQRGASWSGNQETFTGQTDVGPCDFFSVFFTPPPGSTPAQIAQLAGVIATAVVTGTKYTRRG